MRRKGTPPCGSCVERAEELAECRRELREIEANRGADAMALLLALLTLPSPPMPARPVPPPRVVGRLVREGRPAAGVDADAAVMLDGVRCGWGDVAGCTLERVQLDRTGRDVLRLWFKSPAKE